VIALFAVAMAVAGAIVAARSAVPVLALLFGVLAVISATGLRPEGGRRPVRLRPDLARWLDQVSATTAEPVESVLDRSVSEYRASMGARRDE
jgi:hypothetical protein